MRPRAMLAILVLTACGQESSPQRPIDVGSGSDSVTPATGSIEMAAEAKHGVLALTFTNRGTTRATIGTSVTGGTLPHHDWLALELRGHATRTLRFVDNRDESGVVTTDLAPGAAHTVRIDLVQWAVRAGNGGPLAPGTYDLTARWNATGTALAAPTSFSATADTTLVVEPPGAEGCASPSYAEPPGARLIVLGHQGAVGRATLDMGLYNAGTEAVCVDAMIKTHELHYDWFTIQYSDGNKYHHVSRPLKLWDSRDKSYAVTVLLGPGETIWHSVDVDAWARRSINGSEPLPAGSLYTQIVYDTSRETDVWAGRVVSEPFELRVK